MDRAALTNGFRAAASHFHETDDDNSLLVAIENIGCSFAINSGEDKAVNSTYIASHAQTANPDYVQAEQRLRTAQRQLAQIKYNNSLNPATNAWAGAAQGAAEGAAQTAVTRAERALAETPPFISAPVSLPYTRYEYSVQQTAELTATLSVSDVTTGFRDEIRLRGKAIQEATGMRGVLPNLRACNKT